MNYVEKFYNLLERIAKDFDPEKDKYPDFECLFENEILGEINIEEELERAENDFYINKSRFEEYFNSCVEANIKNTQEIEETNDMLNRTFGVF